MKKRIVTLLIGLCMALMVFPGMALAIEGELLSGDYSNGGGRIPVP